MTGPISKFVEHHYRHFNAAALKDAAIAYKKHIDDGGKMMLTLGGAMSSGELGISISQLIREDKVQAISCTGANIEESLFLLLGKNAYVSVPNWRDLTPLDDQKFAEQNLNRVTDFCIPEEEAFRRLEKPLVDLWLADERNGERHFPHENFYRIIRSGVLKPYYQDDPDNCWLLAACEKNLPIFVPGVEDSTTGNYFAGRLFTGEIKNPMILKTGMEYMSEAISWYCNTSKQSSIGIFAIGGGISSDFIQCVVPTISSDFRDLLEPVPCWGYYCQISDSTTSYGSFSGCTPSEKISWKKLSINTPAFIIESDATIVFPLIAAYVLGW